MGQTVFFSVWDGDPQRLRARLWERFVVTCTELEPEVTLPAGTELPPLTHSAHFHMEVCPLNT